MMDMSFLLQSNIHLLPSNIMNLNFLDASLLSTTALPAPAWFIEFFKALGFTLHMVPMNLWFAGLLIALLLHWRGCEHGRQFSTRLMKQMPILIAFGINFGIVPLLFIQVAYYKNFYPATILMAWHWLAIIVLLIPAYYGIYLYTWGLRSTKTAACPKNAKAASGKAYSVPKGNSAASSSNSSSAVATAIPAWKCIAGWTAAFLFLVISFLFVNGMSLLDHESRWLGLWKATQTAGAVSGLALNVGDITLWPRWLLMFGLALTTTAAWAVFDAMWLMGKADHDYQEWAWKFAKVLYTFGMVWTAAAGSWYIVTWSPELRDTMFNSHWIYLTVLTGMATGLPWLLIITSHLCKAERATAAGVAVAQLGVLGINALSRQEVQNFNIHFDSGAEGIPQWGPMAMFLIVFVISVGVIAWMLVKTVSAVRRAG
jgi:hypothetical protein